jgi:hypothetical protein
VEQVGPVGLGRGQEWAPARVDRSFRRRADEGQAVAAVPAAAVIHHAGSGRECNQG